MISFLLVHGHTGTLFVNEVVLLCNECVKHIFTTFLVAQFASASPLLWLVFSHLKALFVRWMSRLEEHCKIAASESFGRKKTSVCHTQTGIVLIL